METKGCLDQPARIGIAFICCTAAGLATVVGSAVLLIFRTNVNKRLIVAGSLAFAAGVMLYVSFVDIYIGKAVGHFEEITSSPAAFLYATLCFFAGMFLTFAVDILARWLASRYTEGANAPTLDAETATASKVAKHADPDDVVDGLAEDVVTAAATAASTATTKKKMLQVGFLAAIAIAMHNLPEGLVTFVGYMQSIESGITLAVAIAIHNIPEGMVVAMPIYCSTGSIYKAVFWTAVSGLTEPIGALIGLSVVCGGALTDAAFGVIFGLVAGIMVLVSVKELLPMARRFDENDSITTSAAVFGMGVMATSLVAINYS
uniref:Zinc transporter, ZIP family n=1 Tax=Tetraselmis sp. GSL018 TaxID=582737 RepID=A0A061RKB0_9CHLO